MRQRQLQSRPGGSLFVRTLNAPNQPSIRADRSRTPNPVFALGELCELFGTPHLRNGSIAGNQTRPRAIPHQAKRLFTSCFPLNGPIPVWERGQGSRPRPQRGLALTRFPGRIIMAVRGKQPGNSSATPSCYRPQIEAPRFNCAPSGITPVSRNLHRSISKRRARATMPTLRARLPAPANRSSNHWVNLLVGWKRCQDQASSMAMARMCRLPAWLIPCSYLLSPLS